MTNVTQLPRSFCNGPYCSEQDIQFPRLLKGRIDINEDDIEAFRTKWLEASWPEPPWLDDPELMSHVQHMRDNPVTYYYSLNRTHQGTAGTVTFELATHIDPACSPYSHIIRYHDNVDVALAYLTGAIDTFTLFNTDPEIYETARGVFTLIKTVPKPGKHGPLLIYCAAGPYDPWYHITDPNGERFLEHDIEFYFGHVR